LEERKHARKQIRLANTLRANADNSGRLERCRNNDDPSADLFRIKARGTIHTPRRGAGLDPKMDCAGDLQRLAIERLCAVNDGQQAGRRNQENVAVHAPSLTSVTRSHWSHSLRALVPWEYSSPLTLISLSSVTSVTGGRYVRSHFRSWRISFYSWAYSECDRKCDQCDRYSQEA